MQKGFTVPELLVVITTIAILAGIITVGYNGVQNRANDVAVRSDLDSTAALLEAYRTNTSSTHAFPASVSDLSALGVTASKNSYDLTASTNFVYCAGASDGQSFALFGLSKSGKSFKQTQEKQTEEAFTKGNFNSATALCGSIGLNLVSSGMSAPNTWASWVGGS